MERNGVEIPEKELEDFCKRNHIRELSLFGSILREDFSTNSDIDILVEFDEGHVPGLIRISSMERELSQLFKGRKVDLRTTYDISVNYRDEVMGSRRVIYGQT
jgi:hypothetical protein